LAGNYFFFREGGVYIETISGNRHTNKILYPKYYNIAHYS
jgi:hypothetical protein